MGVKLKGYDSYDDFITCYEIDLAKKDIYLFGVRQRDDGQLSNIK
ncbi:hypothetical protein [Mesobacillus maritimus]|nr:hypothetical protein [Mesobacillus maritimus]